MHLLDFEQVPVQLIDHDIGQHRNPVFFPLAVTHNNLPVAEINILDTQPYAFHDPQSGAVQHLPHEPFDPFQLQQHLPDP